MRKLCIITCAIISVAGAAFSISTALKPEVTTSSGETVAHIYKDQEMLQPVNEMELGYSFSVTENYCVTKHPAESLVSCLKHLQKTGHVDRDLVFVTLPRTASH